MVILLRSGTNYIDNKFDVRYTVQNVCLLLHQLNFSWITSRSV
ncbi:MAG: winged helix-turn-helix domain-containing protein [Colwellia sp.]|nr:winged helix-turn-helix domain-containing protein [Colwellia sp.]